MKLTFCGAAGTTTGSQHLLEVNGRRILLDCGLFQGRRQDTYERNLHFRFDPGSVDAVILSHAHIDHSGNLPNLVKQGFRGNIFATHATRDLCSVMLADSARIQEGDLAWLNRRRERDELPPLQPLYTSDDAATTMRQFVTSGYDRPLPVADGVTLTFVEAGHILGSAQVLLEIRDQASGGRPFRLLFSGDIGRPGNELLRPAAAVSNVDALILESTYGGRHHEDEVQSDEDVCEMLGQALANRGRIIIPAFAVERTQQLLLVLHRLFESGQLPEVPVFVDSPLAVTATEIFRLHPEALSPEVHRLFLERRDPFGFENLTLMRSVAESRSLNDRPGPMIIISASGMCEGGRVLHHLRNHIGDPSTTILFVGYCAEETLGWKIRNGWQEVRIFGDPFKVKAKIQTLDSFSGHADHDELLQYVDRLDGPLERVWLVHGEPERSAALAAALAERLPRSRIEAPALGDEADF